MIHTEIPPTELADRLAIRELVDAYADCADRRDAEGNKSLFAEDTHFVVYMDGQGSDHTQVSMAASRSRRCSTPSGAEKPANLRADPSCPPETCFGIHGNPRHAKSSRA
jgi:hypothetical protein